MTIERRTAPRYRVIADAEILSPASNASLRGQTADVSLAGCFVNTKEWLAPGTQIQVQLNYGGSTVRAAGEVIRSEPTEGIGVSFGNIRGGPQQSLQNWLERSRPK